MNKSVILVFALTACHIDQKEFAEEQARAYMQELAKEILQR